MWLLPASSVVLWGEGTEKEQWSPPTILSGRKQSLRSHPEARYFSSSPYATGAFQAASLVLELRGSFKSVCGFFKRNCSESSSFSHWLNPHWFLQPELLGTYLPGTGTLGWCAWCAAGTPHSQYIPPNFYPPHVV